MTDRSGVIPYLSLLWNYITVYFVINLHEKKELTSIAADRTYFSAFDATPSAVEWAAEATDGDCLRGCRRDMRRSATAPPTGLLAPGSPGDYCRDAHDAIGSCWRTKGRYREHSVRKKKLNMT